MANIRQIMSLRFCMLDITVILIGQNHTESGAFMAVRHRIQELIDAGIPISVAFEPQDKACKDLRVFIQNLKNGIKLSEEAIEFKKWLDANKEKPRNEEFYELVLEFLHLRPLEHIIGYTPIHDLISDYNVLSKSWDQLFQLIEIWALFESRKKALEEKIKLCEVLLKNNIPVSTLDGEVVHSGVVQKIAQEGRYSKDISEEDRRNIYKIEQERINIMVENYKEARRPLIKTGGVLFILDLGAAHLQRLAAHIANEDHGPNYNLQVILLAAISIDAINRELNAYGRFDEKKIQEFYKLNPPKELVIMVHKSKDVVICEVFKNIMDNIIASKKKPLEINSNASSSQPRPVLYSFDTARTTSISLKIETNNATIEDSSSSAVSKANSQKPGDDLVKYAREGISVKSRE